MPATPEADGQVVLHCRLYSQRHVVSVVRHCNNGRKDVLAGAVVHGPAVFALGCSLGVGITVHGLVELQCDVGDVDTIAV